MLQTKRIGHDRVAVSFDPTEIMIRRSGKQYYNTEKHLVYIRDGVLHIREDVAAEYGIKIVKEGATYGN